MQAALMLRSKSRVARRRKLRKLGGRLELPSNVATKEIAPFPRYPPESWCAQGRAAWLERGRRCSVQEAQHQTVSSKRWIQDASLGGSSDDEDLLGVLRGPSTFANAFLYAGLGTIALGLVIAFVGTGEKGFKTVELRLIGPSLIESKEDQINVNEADDIVRDLPILPDQSPRDSDVLNLRQSTNSTAPMISDNKYVGDLSSCSESNNSCKLLRQRVSINQTKMPEKALSQISPLTTPLISKDENPTECKYQMETSLMYLKNLKLENGVRSTLPENIVQTGSLMHSSLTPIHNALRNQTTKPAGTSATYAAALSAVNANRERNETLIRGPLGMPMHILTATSSTNTQTTSASILKYTTSSLIPAPPPTVPCSTNVCPLRVSSAHENIPGQITEVTKQVNLVSGSALTLGTQANNVAFPSSSAATVTATYSDNLSSRNIPLNIFTGSTTAPTIKCEPELLLSPAKLGQ
ncbi:hypothetical protein GQX74_002494 [Glossina fuscipes]|nr:hypothetical protein GQX74_002494 [Glossina fuscipes]